jgi:succinyl-diaminopimelate desuccinylase
MQYNLTELCIKMLSFKTITPHDDGIMDFIQATLKEIGFEYSILKKFTDINEEAKDTLNLYSSLFSKSDGKNLCFAGHVDVVPPGKEFLWKYPPFEPVIEDGILYGRGAVDMKTAIASFIVAVKEFLEENKEFNKGNISFLLTGDEEDNAINGTQKMLLELKKLGIKLDGVIVGEPTSEEKVGDTVKLGRRGSISFNLIIEGVQGHIAYPHLAKNPIHELGKIIYELSNLYLDDGNQSFSPSSLQIVKIETENKASNVIPKTASCFFNIRFNNFYSGEDLIKLINNFITSKTNFNFKLSNFVSGECFLTNQGELSNCVKRAIFDVCDFETKFSTSGGTSDARFIKNYAPVLELGVLNKTAHKIDENSSIEDIYKLKDIYKKILMNFFYS